MYVVTVQSPLAGCLALADLYRQRLTDQTWRRAWDLIWDKIPRASRSQVQSIAHLVEIIEHPDLGGSDLSGALWSGRINGAIWAETRTQMGVPDEADGEARRLWRVVEDWIAPHHEDAGVWTWQLRGVLLETEAPERFIRDDRDRLHDAAQAAAEYTDGFAVHAWHGVRVPPDVILKPQTITVEQVEREPNAEVRRVLIERYGQERYIRDCGAQEIHRDACGILYRKEFRGDAPLVFVCVKNSTPEPDGSIKSYWLRVDPHCTTAHQAVAWTFGLATAEYRPNIET